MFLYQYMSEPDTICLFRTTMLGKRGTKIVSDDIVSFIFSSSHISMGRKAIKEEEREPIL